MPGDMRKERMSGRRTSYRSMFTLSRFRAGSNSVKAAGKGGREDGEDERQAHVV